MLKREASRRAQDDVPPLPHCYRRYTQIGSELLSTFGTDHGELRMQWRDVILAAMFPQHHQLKSPNAGAASTFGLLSVGLVGKATDKALVVRDVGRGGCKGTAGEWHRVLSSLRPVSVR